MKRTQLSKEQKTNLIEICKSMFPEFNNISFGVSHWGDQVWFDQDGHNRHEFHWFELCATELPSRLFKAVLRENEKLEGRIGVYKETKREMEIDPSFENGADVIQKLLWEKVHPVDLLYQEFKKLN